MQNDKYADQLLAQQATIPTNTIFEILLGYSWRDLSDYQKRIRRGSSLAMKKNTAKEMADSAFLEISMAKPFKREIDQKQKAWRKSRGERSLVEATEKPYSFDVEKVAETYLSLLIASGAYSVLSKWMGIKFHNDSSRLNLGQQYQTSGFFRWIDSDGILARLEEQVDGFKAPDRAHEFIGYVREAHKIASQSEQVEKEPSPPKETANDCVFQKTKNGDFWEICFKGDKLPPIKNIRGFDFIRILIERQGEEVTLYELDPQSAAPLTTEKSKRKSEDDKRCHSTEQETESGLFIQAGLKSRLPNLDKSDIAKYLNMKKEAEGKLREAEDARDVGEQTEQKRIIDTVDMVLNQDITPDGDQRHSDPGWNNARKNIPKRIKDAIKKIRNAHPGLADHFEDQIAMTPPLSYNLGTPHPILWEI